MAAKKSPKKKRGPVVKKSVYYRGLTERLGKAADGFNFRQISDMTGGHPENVRRYMGNGRAPVHFISEVARAFQVSPKWLLLGDGPMRARG